MSKIGEAGRKAQNRVIDLLSAHKTDAPEFTRDGP